jgi:threonine/homoserine/homoserine lactone efflux protein
VRSAMRGGPRAAIRTIAGNQVGVIAWALLSIAGISALVAASEVAFIVLKVAGAAVLVYLGVQSLRGGRPALARAGGRAFRDGVVTSLANPKLAVFFVALFPQFISPGSSVLPTTLLMAALICVFDLVWYTALAVLASRAKTAGAKLTRSMERTTGAVLIALGARVALESR